MYFQSYFLVKNSVHCRSSDRVPLLFWPLVSDKPDIYDNSDCEADEAKTDWCFDKKRLAYYFSAAVKIFNKAQALSPKSTHNYMIF